ncbi:MAG: type II toxin-antitoxin system HicB family antitoxin [Cyanobacteriota bacterium]|nr:type II toxin-antitoxin system HicB family antitoxin [Cyanobacteriota bacterium]
MMNYKGYTGFVEKDEEAGIWFGRVIGIKDVITFKAESIEESREEFQISVDDYLEFCQELNREPEQPFSGEVAFNTTPENYQKIWLAAQKTGKSINAWMDEVLSAAAEKTINA